MKKLDQNHETTLDQNQEGTNVKKLTPSEYAKLKGISPRTVRNQIKNNLVNSVKDGGSRFILVSQEEIDRTKKMETEIETLTKRVSDLEKKQSLTDNELTELKATLKSISQKTKNHGIDLEKIKAILPNIDVSKKL